MNKKLALMVAVCLCGMASLAYAGATVTVTDIGSDDVAALTQPIRAFPVPAAAGWTGAANLVYDNYAEGIAFSSGWLYSELNWVQLPLGNAAVDIHGVSHSGGPPVAIDDTKLMFTNEEGSEADDPGPPDKRWPYHIPRPGQYCGMDFTCLEFDLADDSGLQFGVFLPAHSNTWSDDDDLSWDDHNYVLQTATVDVYVRNVGEDWTTAEHVAISLNPSGNGSFCPFLMIEDTEGIDAVAIIHDSGAYGSPTYGFMDVYSDVPEPMTMGLLLTGAAGLLIRRKR
ncbi:MAG TPA: PEP-CTERM sorting domain-containing protein [Phycisphaerae bacterium]|nr:PEP-CTERM sorting domain-containing protein [Phycisphaerae bacterium]HUU21954.1 PEP-CTERM sorting domain-containing protein [Phycisphaerae bacterium]